MREKEASKLEIINLGENIHYRIKKLIKSQNIPNKVKSNKKRGTRNVN